MNQRRIRTQSLALILVVSFLIPSGLLVLLPQKAEAQANCVAPIAGAVSSIGILAGVEKAMGVTTSQPSNAAGQTVGAGASFGTFFNNCILKPLAITMARTMVRNISNSIVNWINSGFQGKPGFVTDFRGLVANSADQAIGNFIYGSDLKFLCQPFSVRIKLQLATKYQRNFQDEIKCTLTDIKRNVNGFVTNNGGAGWDNWLAITTQPQNNEWGAYFIAESELASRIQTQLDQVNKELEWGRGFTSYKVCDEKAPDRETGAQASLRVSEAEAREDAGQFIAKEDFDPTPRCKTGGRVVTPGSLVGEQANKVLGSWSDQLNLATEIDQIVGALISHFADKMISGTQGFLGLSSPGGYARSNISVNQALAAGDDVTSSENVGLDVINTEAQKTSATFTEEFLAPQEIESGVNITQNLSVRVSGPSGVAQTALESIADGNTSSVGTIGSIAAGSQFLWARLDLGTSTQVSEIHVWYPDGMDPAESIGTFNVVFSNGETDRTWVSNEYTLKEGSPNPTVVRINRTGRYITLEKKATCSENCPPLKIAEIEVIGKAPNNPIDESGMDTGDTTKLHTVFGPTNGEGTYAPSGVLNIEVPIITNKNVVVKSLEANLYSGNSLTAFNSLLSGGITLKQGGASHTIYPGTRSGIKFTNLALSSTSDTSIIINGTMNQTAAAGTYKFILEMKDDTGEILDTRTVNFVVQ